MNENWHGMVHAVHLLGVLAEDAGAPYRNPTDLENQETWDRASYLVDHIKQHLQALKCISDGDGQ